MSDVRLTATNPEDSSVVPVACNERGELLVKKPEIGTVTSNVTFKGDVVVDLTERTADSLIWSFQSLSNESDPTSIISSFEGRRTDGKVLQFLAYGGAQEWKRTMEDGFSHVRINRPENIFAAKYQEDRADIYSVDWQGRVNASNFLLRLEPENPAHYSTDDEYIGPVFDVREELDWLGEPRVQ